MHPVDDPEDCQLLFWNFDNVMSEGGVSSAIGHPSNPSLASGLVSQTGGGPAELWGETGYVFLTRHLGTNVMFLSFTLTQPTFLTAVRFRHWHNHNPGFPTHPSYDIQLQLDSGDGYENIGEPLRLSDKNSGSTDTLAINRQLEPGNYKLRWHPKGLKRKAKDTHSEFLAIKDLSLHGYATEVHPCEGVQTESVTPTACLPEYVTLTIGGLDFERVKVMLAKYAGMCLRSGREFEAGNVIGFKHRNALTAAEKDVLFSDGRPTHLTVLLEAAEIAGTNATEAKSAAPEPRPSAAKPVAPESTPVAATYVVRDAKVTGFSGPYAAGNWKSGNIKKGNTSIHPVASDACQFQYKVLEGGGGVTRRLAKFRVRAEATGVVTFDFRYEIYHAWFDVHAAFTMFADTPEGRQVLRVVKFHGPQSVGPKVFTGAVAIHVVKGCHFGFAIGGSNFDSDSRLEGTLTLSNFAAPLE